MENIKTLIQHVAEKEFIQFGDELKSIVQEKISAHPRMVQHNEKVRINTEQKEIYSKIEQYIKEPEKEPEQE